MMINLKTTQYRARLNQFMTVACGILGLTIVSWPAAFAAQTTAVVGQTYTADSSVQSGMLVELRHGRTGAVTALSDQDTANLLGVVVPLSQAPIALTPASGGGQQVLVEPSGSYEVLVSNQNGQINPGDYLSMSSLPGIAMKSESTQPRVVGKAITGFSGTRDVIESLNIKSGSGKSLSVAVGTVVADIRLAQNPAYSNSGGLPSFLTRTASSLANKPVSTSRIYMSGAILIAAFVMTGSMFYSAVRSGITAIGRNPLSKKFISKGLLQVVVIGMIVFIVSVVIAYLVLIV